MSLTDLIASQLTDPFRIALIIGLVVTMFRTQAATGTWLPLAAGALFVAVIVPMTFHQIAFGPDLLRAVATGLVSNAILIGVALGGWSLIRRFRG